jgi:capsid protein
MRRTKAQIMEERRELARMQYDIARYTRAAKVLQKWDATEPQKQRRTPSRENGGEDAVYDVTRRLRGCALGRDLERNYSPAKSMMHQFRVNVVGSLGKLKINTDDGQEGTEYFNQVWSKDCDYRDDIDWSLMCGNVLCSAIREGDMLAVFDDQLTEDDSGKLLTWEADQVVPVSDDVLKAKGFDAHTQDNGIIRDKWGKVVAYAATGKHGAGVVNDPESVTIFPRGIARLVSNPWRLNQGRGTPSILTPSTNFIDLYEILSAQLITAKRALSQYAYVRRKDAVTDFDDPTSGAEFLPENMGRTAAEVATDGANQSAQTEKNYESLEAHTGGLMDYIAPEDEVVFPAQEHPNPDLAAFLDAVNGYSGASMGLARAYSLLRADSSYTSFRGDMIMTWVTFYWLQKRIERAFADWVAVKVIEWAIRRKVIRGLVDGWQRKISWTWPTMPEVDELDAQNAIAAALKNGTTNYSELLGPDWRARMESYAEQVAVIRELGLPLSVLEMKSGGVANQKKETVNE